MKRNKVLLIILIYFPLNLFSQIITQRGSAEWIEQQGKLFAKSQIAKYVIPNNILETKISKLDLNNNFSMIIGADIEVTLDFFEWSTVEENDTFEIRSIEIESPHALFLALIFDEFWLPFDDEVYIYNRNKTVLMGPFTNRNNPNRGSYATDIIEGDNLIVEHHRKKNNFDKRQIIISKVIHGLNPMLLDTIIDPTISKGNCLVDVNCQEGDGWDNQKNGACFILKLGDTNNPNTSGSPWASAVLINNTRQDGTPYIFTAWHNTQGTGSNLSLWIFRFKYWRTTCNGSVNSVTFSYCGGQMLEAWENDNKNNDVALIQMFEKPDPANDIYYCGWNRNTSVPSSSILISHPQLGNL